MAKEEEGFACYQLVTVIELGNVWGGRKNQIMIYSMCGLTLSSSELLGSSFGGGGPTHGWLLSFPRELSQGFLTGSVSAPSRNQSWGDETIKVQEPQVRKTWRVVFRISVVLWSRLSTILVSRVHSIGESQRDSTEHDEHF